MRPREFFARRIHHTAHHWTANGSRRCVAGVQRRAATYAGIGLDIATGAGWGNVKTVSPPQRFEDTVAAAFRAGAVGIVASREYEEISLSSLQAVGRAVRSASGAKRTLLGGIHIAPFNLLDEGMESDYFIAVRCLE